MPIAHLQASKGAFFDVELNASAHVIVGAEQAMKSDGPLFATQVYNMGIHGGCAAGFDGLLNRTQACQTP